MRATALLGNILVLCPGFDTCWGEVREILKAADTLPGGITELASGNMGAAWVLGRIIVEPLTSLLILLDLQRIGLWHEQIWLLHRDVHGMSLVAA
jgi:hypothetical protein